MKRILIIFSIIILFILLVVFKVTSSQRGQVTPVLNLSSPVKNSCGGGEEKSDALINSKLPELRRLAELEKLCRSAPVKKLMLFTNMPKDDVTARDLAQQVGGSLLEYAKFGIEPIVIVEPQAAWGLIDFKEFESGFYDGWLEVFFKELKQMKLSDKQMGTWVPFPEANLPYWNHQNTQPADFAAVVNHYLGIYKKFFPQGKASILLNSATYPTDDYDWREGRFISLLPYLEGLNKEYITSFGYQGLPWTPPANEVGMPLFAAEKFLDYRLALEAAEYLGVKEIWFNTGTFAAKYAQNQDNDAVVVPAETRREVLDGILQQAKNLYARGFRVSVNIFAEDKSKTAEETDWSYWGSSYTQDQEHQQVLLDFIASYNKEGLGELSFFLR